LVFNNDNASGAIPEIGTESIQPQHNDYVVSKIKGLFENIIGNMKKHNIKTAKGVFKNRDNKKLIKELDHTLSTRFGINFTHTFSVNSGYAVWTIPPKNANVLNKNIVNTAEVIEEYSRKTDGDNAHTRIETNRNAETQINSIMASWNKSMQALEKTLNAKGLIIDLKQAMIIGLPKEYNIYLTCDLDMLVNHIELNAEELTAILLHEVGHAFTHLEYAYRSVTNTSAIMDTIQESIDKDRPYKETLRLIYEDVLEKDSSEIANNNEITATIKLADEYIRTSIGMIPIPHGETDSEMLADQFAGRFGLVGPLTSGLDKVHQEYPEMTRFDMCLSVSLMLGMYVFIYALILAGGLMGSVFIAIGTILTSMVVGFIVSFLDTVESTGAKTYDDSKRRVQRIYNDTVRQLRGLDLGKQDDIIKHLLMELKDIKTIIDKTPSPTKDLGERIWSFVSSKQRDKDTMKGMEMVIEDLLNNDLHIASKKIGLLIK